MPASNYKITFETCIKFDSEEHARLYAEKVQQIIEDNVPILARIEYIRFKLDEDPTFYKDLTK